MVQVLNGLCYLPRLQSKKTTKLLQHDFRVVDDEPAAAVQGPFTGTKRVTARANADFGAASQTHRQHRKKKRKASCAVKLSIPTRWKRPEM